MLSNMLFSYGTLGCCGFIFLQAERIDHVILVRLVVTDIFVTSALSGQRQKCVAYCIRWLNKGDVYLIVRISSEEVDDAVLIDFLARIDRITCKGNVCFASRAFMAFLDVISRTRVHPLDAFIQS